MGIASSANSLDETNSLQMLFVLFKDGFCQSFFIFWYTFFIMFGNVFMFIFDNVFKVICMH